LARLKATELERAREVWRRKFPLPPLDAAERARQMRFLAARGFATEVIRRVVGSGPDEL
jgi:regulatory protein